jgi:hypothetical protein
MPSLGDHRNRMYKLVERIGDGRIIAPETLQPFVAAVLPHGLAAHDEARQLKAAMLGRM